MWKVWWMFHKVTGFRQWESPKRFKSLRGWALWCWNEYDDWLYNGIHGIRILGAEFDTEPKWISKLCWKLLPFLRFVIRRPEYIGT